MACQIKNVKSEAKCLQQLVYYTAKEECYSTSMSTQMLLDMLAWFHMCFKYGFFYDLFSISWHGESIWREIFAQQIS